MRGELSRANLRPALGPARYPNSYGARKGRRPRFHSPVREQRQRRATRARRQRYSVAPLFGSWSRNDRDQRSLPAFPDRGSLSLGSGRASASGASGRCNWPVGARISPRDTACPNHCRPRRKPQYSCHAHRRSLKPSGRKYQRPTRGLICPHCNSCGTASHQASFAPIR